MSKVEHVCDFCGEAVLPEKEYCLIHPTSSMSSIPISLEWWAEAHQVSYDIACHIDRLASSLAEMERIWQDPTPDEKIAIWEAVTRNGLCQSTEFIWGLEGEEWAKDIEAEA